jgi:hypothetical protein
MGVYVMGVHVMDMYLIGVHLIGVYSMVMYLMGVHFIGVYLMGVHLTGVHLMGACLIGVLLINMYLISVSRRCVPHKLLWMPRAWQGSCNKCIVVLILVLRKISTQSINKSIRYSIQVIINGSNALLPVTNY